MAFILVFTGLAKADLARVGPANTPAPPGHGFPFWYQDLTGMVLDICLPDANDPGALQKTACLLGPPDPPYVFPTNFPDEVFYNGTNKGIVGTATADALGAWRVRLKGAGLVAAVQGDTIVARSSIFPNPSSAPFPVAVR